MSQDKAKTLKITTDQIEQKFGKGAIMKLGENTNMQVGVIPTGALPIRYRFRHRWRSSWSNC